MDLMLVFFVLGLVLIALAIPMALRKVPPNRLYGLRVPATFADESVWYDANARSGRDLIVVGAVLSALALALKLARVPLPTAMKICAVVLPVIVLGAVIRGWRHANALLRQRRG